MGFKRTVLHVFSIFFAVFSVFTGETYAQRIEPLRNGSVYVGVGYSKAWFIPSGIHVKQPESGNDFKFVKVRADNYSATSISLWQLSYRIGFYYDYPQSLALELNFDPVNYRVKENAIVQVKGTLNHVPDVKKNILFTYKNGYYYSYNGANIVLLNLVRRFELYRNRKNNIRVDALVKGGIGPAFPHVVNSLPATPYAGPQFKFGGWNAGAEAGLRGTFFRYFYLEFAGKYDFAYLYKLDLGDGSAKQLLHTYEAIASIGFTFPTSKDNPLFRRPGRIVTILPFYEQSKLLKEGSGDADDPNDTTNHNRFKVIPPFDDILEKEQEEAAEEYLRLHPPDTFNNMDSIAAVENMRIADSTAFADSVFRQDSADHVYDSINSKKERKRRKREYADSVNAAQKAMQDSLNSAANEAEMNNANNAGAPPSPAADTATGKPAEPADEKPGKKEEKKKAKQEKKEAKKREKEAEEEAKRKARAEEEERKAKEQEEADKKAEEEKSKEDSEPPKDGN